MNQTIKRDQISQKKDMNPNWDYVLKKVEKLASAVHMVTENIPVNEPLRSRIRDRALEIVSKTTSEGSRGGVHISDTLSRTVPEIVMYITIGQNSGQISAMNAKVLNDEYESLLDFLRDRYYDLAGSPTGNVSVNYFALEEPKTLTPTSLQTTDKQPSRIPQRSQSVGVALENRAAQVTTETETRETISQADRKASRRETILDLLKGQKVISIKDVSSRIQDCSEKTLQRELLAMVEEEILDKQGERRWSTYSLRNTT